MNVDGRFFWNNNNIGLFFHESFTIPAAGDENYDFQLSTLIGPAFRVRFTDKLSLQPGLGIAVNGIFARYEERNTDYLRSMVNFGVGAGLGLKFDITDTVFINCGVNAAWTFLGLSTVDEMSLGSKAGKTKKMPTEYWTLNASPYISVGINMYSQKQRIEIPSERPQFGKPHGEEVLSAALPAAPEEMRGTWLAVKGTDEAKFSITEKTMAAFFPKGRKNFDAEVVSWLEIPNEGKNKQDYPTRAEISLKAGKRTGRYLLFIHRDRTRFVMQGRMGMLWDYPFIKQ
ncbi:hypothetical protein FACS189445_4420 [Spirochaetia bacterium]|nr:hypothetical protein FACS189445_4420 [Spirochaetia bacterium]